MPELSNNISTGDMSNVRELRELVQVLEFATRHLFVRITLGHDELDQGP